MTGPFTNKTIYDLPEIYQLGTGDFILVGAQGTGGSTGLARISQNYFGLTGPTGAIGATGPTGPAAFTSYTATPIDLSTIAYAITTPGIYWITDGTNPITNHLLTLPSPASYLGKQLILVNSDLAYTAIFTGPPVDAAGNPLVVAASSVMTLIAVYSPVTAGNIWLSI